MATLFRATIMLGTLVGIPATWIYLGPLPKEAQQAVDRFVASGRAMLGMPTSDRRAAAESAASWDLGRAKSPSEQVTRGERVSRAPATSPALEPHLSRLRRLGAVEYRLVRWGTSGQHYRFCCWLPLGSGNEHLQQFESIADNPDQCISQVVADATDWHAARVALGRGNQVVTR